MWNVTLYTDGNLIIHINVQARNAAAAWEIAIRRPEAQTKFEIDSGDVKEAA